MNIYQKVKKDFSFYLCNDIINKMPFHSLRLFIYRHIFGLRIGKNSSVGMHTVLLDPRNIRIGNNCAIARYVLLDGRGGLEIGNNVNISFRCSVYTSSHNQKSPEWEFIRNKVVIENDCWVASNSTVLPGVHLFRGAVAAAGSVVAQNVKSFDVVGGNPAKKISKRPSKINYLTDFFPLFY